MSEEIQVLYREGQPDFSVCWVCLRPNNWDAQPCMNCWKQEIIETMLRPVERK